MTLDVNPVLGNKSSLWAERSKPIKKVDGRRSLMSTAQQMSGAVRPFSVVGCLARLAQRLKRGVFTARRT